MLETCNHFWSFKTIKVNNLCKFKYILIVTDTLIDTVYICYCSILYEAKHVTIHA